MEKKKISKNSDIFPGTALMVSCSYKGQDNIITIAWISKVCREPPKIAIAIDQQRHSYDIVKKSKAFVVNIPSVDQVRNVDYCGTKSGRDVDKFKECKFTKINGELGIPMIKECPINVECKVTESMLLGSHEVFIGEVIAYWVDSELQDGFDYEKIDPIVYLSPDYWGIGKIKGKWGFSK